MDNENLNPVETEETLDTQAESSFDEGWGDEPTDNDDFDLSEETAEAAEEQEPDAQPEPDEAEQQEAPEETGESEPENAGEAAPEKQPEAENQRFKLKYNGAESEVDREKVIELAQKGMDYDRIKAERDSFKAEAPTLHRYKEQEAFLKELADNSGMGIEQLMENTRVRMLMGRDKTLTEEAALQKVREDAAAKQAAEKKEEQKAAEPTPEERRQAMFANFLRAYPDVKADSIPKEVWEDAGRTFDLTGAYQRYESRQIRDENRKLQAEIETLRQNNKNKERSTGSRRSVGSTKPKDDFDEAWDSF